MSYRDYVQLMELRNPWREKELLFQMKSINLALLCLCRVPHLFSFIATRSKVFVIEIQPNLDPSVFVERLASLFTDTERTWKGESLMDQKTFKLISGLVLKSSPSPSMSCCSLQLTHTSALAIQLNSLGFAINHQSLYIETKRELVKK